jgi:hypothetical protein
MLFGCFLEKGWREGGGLRGFGGARYPPKPLIFNSPKLGEFGGGGGRDST